MSKMWSDFLWEWKLGNSPYGPLVLCFPLCSVNQKQRVQCSPVCFVTVQHRTLFRKVRKSGPIWEMGSYVPRSQHKVGNIEPRVHRYSPDGGDSWEHSTIRCTVWMVTMVTLEPSRAKNWPFRTMSEKVWSDFHAVTDSSFLKDEGGIVLLSRQDLKTGGRVVSVCLQGDLMLPNKVSKLAIFGVELDDSYPVLDFLLGEFVVLVDVSYLLATEVSGGIGADAAKRWEFWVTAVVVAVARCRVTLVHGVVLSSALQRWNTPTTP